MYKLSVLKISSCYVNNFFDSALKLNMYKLIDQIKYETTMTSTLHFTLKVIIWHILSKLIQYSCVRLTGTTVAFN